MCKYQLSEAVIIDGCVYSNIQMSEAGIIGGCVNSNISCANISWAFIPLQELVVQISAD